MEKYILHQLGEGVGVEEERDGASEPGNPVGDSGRVIYSIRKMIPSSWD